jgi:hypothetical protein
MTRWVAQLASHKHNTARTYLNAVNHERRRRELKTTTEEAYQRRRIIAAAKRTERGPQGRAGIYERDLQEEHKAVSAKPSHRKKAILAAGSTALACGMRCSEYTGGGTVELHKDGRESPPSPPMQKKHAKFGIGKDGNRWVDITLERTKWWNQSVRFRLHETHSRVDAYRQIREMYQSTKPGDGPLFTTQPMGDRAVSRRDMTALCKRIQKRSSTPQLKRTPHSFRVGTARSLLRAGVERMIIDGWCRWRGKSGDIYLQLTPDDVESAMVPIEGKRITEKVFRRSARLRRGGTGKMTHTRC